MSCLVAVVQVARDTHGFVGADIAQLCMEAALACIAEKVNSRRTTTWISTPASPRDVIKTHEYSCFVHSIADIATLLIMSATHAKEV